MKIKFIGVPGEDHRFISMYGYEFPLGKFVEVDRPEAIRKLSKHPHFEAKGGDVTDLEFKIIGIEGDGANQLAKVTGDFDKAAAEIQGKEPAPNTHEGLVEDKPAKKAK